ncbi:MAG: tetratricopeptide repeat protein [Acidobacteriota bacterium]
MSHGPRETPKAPPPWARIRDLLDRVLDLPAPERARAVHDAEADTELKNAVLSMLSAYQEETEPFARAAVDVSGLLGDLWGPGDAIGAYRLIERVGEGGMGTVFVAQRADDSFSKKVAIKLIRRGWASDEEIRRFRSERQILADLEHPSIARLLDGGETPRGQPFLVMELVNGRPIDVHCREQTLDLEGRLSLFLEVCRAVQYAHQSLIVHRDLKPSNILVATSADGETTQSGGAVKLLDFGIAKILEGSDFSGPVEKTRTGSTPMTPAYASPEQVSGQPITTATDVYSLGMLLYQLLTGDLPYRFVGHDLQAIVNAVVLREVTAPSQRLREHLEKTDPDPGSPEPAVAAPAKISPKTLRGDLDAIVLKALAKEPERRYATAEQFADDLERYLDHRPVRARRDTVLYRGVKFLHRYRLGLGAAAATFAILVASLFVLLNQQESLVQERNRALELQRHAQTVTGYLVELFKLPDPSQSKGENITARELLDKSSRTIDQDLADQPRLLPDLLRVLSETYGGLGQLDDARSLVERAIARARQDDPNDPRLPELLYPLSDVLSRSGEYGAARVAVSEALARLGPSPPPERRLLYVRALNQRGNLESRLGRFDDARATLERALELGRETGDPETLGLILERLGELASYTGHPEESRRRYTEAIGLYRQAFDEQHPRILLLKSSLGALRQTEDPEAAGALLRQAIAEQRELFGGSHPKLAVALNNLGVLLDDQGDFAGAEDALAESLAMKLETLSPNHPSYGMTLGNMAKVKSSIGDVESATRLYRQALDVLGRSVGPRNGDYCLVLSNLGTLYLQRGDLDAAEPLLEDALRGFVDGFGDRHPDALTVRVNLAFIEESRGDLEGARGSLREAIAAADGEQTGIAYSRAMLNLATLETKLGDPETAAELHYAIAEREGGRSQIGLFALTYASRHAFDAERWLEAETLATTAELGLAKRDDSKAWLLSAQRTRALAILEQGRIREAHELLAARLATIEERRREGLSSQSALDTAEADLARADEAPRSSRAP